MSTWPAYAILALAWIGAAAIAKWTGEAIGWVAWKVQFWSECRAFNLCGQAILDYEFDRGVSGVVARRFANDVMNKSEMPS